MYISSNSGSDVNQKKMFQIVQRSDQIIFQEMFSVYFKVF